MTLPDIVRKYAGEDHVRGKMDCNLMVLELHDPSVYQAMFNKYTDLDNGVQRSRQAVGAVSMRQYLKRNPSYKRISPDYQRQGDVVVFPKGFNCYLSFGDKWFGVNEQDKFGFIPMNNYSPEEYMVFRKE